MKNRTNDVGKRWKKSALILTIALIVMICTVYMGSVSSYAATFVSSQTIEENIVYNENVYIDKGVEVTFNGNVTINGSLYIKGTLNNTGRLTVSDSIYCLHYGSMFSAGDYDYGYLNNKGSVSADSLTVNASWLSVSIPKDESAIEAEQPETPSEPKVPNKDNNSSEPEIPAPSQSSVEGFPDVTLQTVNKTSYDAIYWAVYNSIVKGYADGNFQPEMICTREQFSIMLWRFVGEPDADANAVTRFTDAHGFSNGARKAVAWAVEQGIVAGFNDGSFKPKDDITRAQVAVMLWRYAGKPSVDVAESKFSDIGSFSATVQQAIIWAENAGIASGYKDGTFKPNDGCQRQHMAIFLFRYAGKVLGERITIPDFVYVADPSTSAD